MSKSTMFLLTKLWFSA